MTDTIELRDKEHVVLQQIQEGNDDVQKITQATTLENHHVTYAFEKMEKLGLVDVSRPEGMVERVIDGQKRVFRHPKQAELTEKGVQYLETSERGVLGAYEDLSHKELVGRVHELGHRIDELEKKFEVFQEQVREKL